jgi:hypothetical protein
VLFFDDMAVTPEARPNYGTDRAISEASQEIKSVLYSHEYQDQKNEATDCWHCDCRPKLVLRSIGVAAAKLRGISSG